MGLIPGETDYPSLEEILRRRDKLWFFGGPGNAVPLARPETIFTCGVCGSNKYCYRFWRWHIRKHSRIKHRCDVAFKCANCSITRSHGIIITEEEHARYEKHIFMKFSSIELRRLQFLELMFKSQ